MAPRRHKPAATATDSPGVQGGEVSHRIDADAGGNDGTQGDVVEHEEGAEHSHAGHEEDGAYQESVEDADGDYEEDADVEDDADDSDAETGEYAEDDEGESEADAEYEDDEGEDEYEAAEDDYDKDGGADAEYEDDEAEDEYDEDSDEDADSATDRKAFTPPTALSAIRNSFRSPRQKAQPATGTAADEQRVNFIESRERMIGYFLGVLMMALSVVTYVHYAHFVDKTDIKLQKDYRRDAPWVSAVTFGLGLMIVLATQFKRRAALAFTVLLAGVANFSVDPVIGFVYLGTGLWLVFRAMRRSPRSRTAAAGAGSRAGPTRADSRATMAAAGRARADADSARSSKSSSRTSAPGRTIGRNGRISGVPVSGRYTPPKPTRHVPPAVQPEPEPTNRLSSWLKK